MSAALTLFERYVSERGAPDLVHVHIADPAGMFALRVKERFGIPYVLTEHATWLARGGKGKISDGVARAVIAGASACIAVSPDLARRLTDRFPGPSGGWRCIPNMVDPIFLDVRLGGNRPRSRDSFVFLYVANLIPRKGHDLLLRSFARAFGSEKTTRLRLVGGGPLRRSLQRLAARLGIADRVHLVGPLSRTGVMEEVAACNAIAVPSEFETFGVILIEAMAAGKPAVSTRCGGPEWIVTDDTGLLIDARDDHAFSDALLRMRHEAATYDPQAIRREAQRRFAPKVVSVALSQVYREVAG